MPGKLPANLNLGAVVAKFTSDIHREEFVQRERAKLLSNGVPPSTAHALAELEYKKFKLNSENKPRQI